MSVAESNAATTNGVSNNNGSVSTPALDVSRLHSLPSEQQDLYLLTFTAGLDDYVRSLDKDGVSSQQRFIKKELVQIIKLSSPVPTRVIRNSIGRCFAEIFGRGDRKLLYESINELLGIINAGKGEKEPRKTHAAVHCLGEIFRAAGDSAISLSSLTCSSLIRLLKSAQNHVGLRGATFKALGKIVDSVRGSIDEAIAREIWKQARASASADKAAYVQISACECLQDLVKGTTHFDNASDFESLKSAIWKICDSSVAPVRRSGASCLASILVKSYSEDAIDKSAPKVKKSSKASKRQPMVIGANGDETVRADSPSRVSVAKLGFSFSDLLRQLSVQYIRTSTSNKARAAIAQCYSKVLLGLDSTIVEKHYALIADHLLVDVLGSLSISQNRYRLLSTRSSVQHILGDVVGHKILGETGQINAGRALINNVLKNYPQITKERPAPNKQALTGALGVLSSLIQRLGSAFNVLGDICREALAQVLQHPSYTVQIYASYCLRMFTLACPHYLIPCASICLNSLNRELGFLMTGRQSSRRCVGFANGLAAVLSISPMQPLYSSIEISSRVLSLATELLKSSSNFELRVSGAQVQVAWILIGGLMALGPNFVKIHLPQLLLLWKNALPKPLTKENTAQRQAAEINYLTHVRECALGSILSFLEFNSKLITTDVSRRLAVMLQNTTEFLNNMPSKKDAVDFSQRTTPALQLQDLTLMVRRRVFQCYTKLVNLSPLASGEILTQSNLLSLSMAVFADPENHAQSSLGSSIAQSAGTFDGIWDIADNWGFGLTGFVRALEIKPIPGEHNSALRPHWLHEDAEGSAFDRALSSPICGAREHDSVYLCMYGRDGFEELPDPPATEVVNSAIGLFAVALPLQAPRVQEGVLEQLATFVSASSLQRDQGRKAAVTVNVAMALLAALKVGGSETLAAPGDLKHPAVEKILQELLQALIVHQDECIRNIAYEALGRLCNISGNLFTTNEVSILIDTIVSNRDPNARAGCAMALGSIHSLLGGMAAGYHLKSIQGVLMSLCKDPHPAVHFWAIEALSKVADSAGLTFSPYVSSTLGMLAQLWTCDTHNEESASLAISNTEVEHPTSDIIAHGIDCLINVLGPDLQDMSKARDLIFTLVKQFEVDPMFIIRAESLRCWEHISLYASSQIDFSTYVRRLQRDLNSPQAIIHEMAIDGLYNLMRRDAEAVLGAADAKLEDQIWAVFDESSSQQGIKNILEVWLGQTSLTKTDQWITRCQNIVTNIASRSGEAVQPAVAQIPAAPDLQDEEVAGFATSGNAKEENPPAPDAVQELLPWRVRAFAVECLSHLLAIVGRDIQLDPDSPAGHALQNRLADVIRLAFLSSTSDIVELRIGGLKLIDQILTIFGRTPDPDFTEALLLEQYQAQISSALTPAFAADSSAELASEAVNVCGTFIAAGLVTDVDRMGRILKLLVSALQSFTSDAEDSAVGDLKGLGANAQTMVKMAVLSAWAELQVASIEQPYLVDVVKPYIAKLTPLWLESLQEFARLRFEPDISNSTAPSDLTNSLDMLYSALNRQTLLKFYQDSWLNLVNAIASLIDQDSAFVFDALDGKTAEGRVNGTITEASNINYRDEPVAFFFVLFGISFEALMTRPNNDTPEAREQTLEILLALKRILRPSVSGNAIYQDNVFSETMELFDRLVLTDGSQVQAVIVDIARNLCLAHPSAKEADGEDHLSDDIEQLFELTRIVVLVLAGVLPNLTEDAPLARHPLSDEAVSLIRLSLETLVDASNIFPSIIKTDLHACITHIFATILATGHCQELVVPQALPIFRRFIQSITLDASDVSTITDQVRGCLQRFLSILAFAQRRETEASLLGAKNNLLASTILLTSSSSVLPPNEPLITTFLDETLDCLHDVGLAKVAANCLRSLLLISPKSGTDETIARYLIPRLLLFMGDTTQEDPENARSLVARALTSFVSTLKPGTQIPTALCLILPALLSRASAVGKDVFPETAARLFELAGADQGGFKGVVGQMSAEQKTFMEQVIREGGVGTGNRSAEDKAAEEIEPTIALKLNFGEA